MRHLPTALLIGRSQSAIALRSLYVFSFYLGMSSCQQVDESRPDFNADSRAGELD